MGAGASSLGSVKDLLGGSNFMIDDEITRALQVFLKNPKARMAFDSFVKNDSWKENNINQDALYDLSQTVYSKFLVGENSSDKSESNILFFAAIFPLFLGSKEYVELMQSGGLAELSEEDEEDDDDDEDEDDDTSSEDLPTEIDTKNLLSKEGLEETEIAYAFIAKSSMDLNFETPKVKEKKPINSRKSIVRIDPCVVESDALKSECIQKNCIAWLRDFLAYTEDHKNAITLASARKDRPGFPLIYVNKAFESITGYSRADILGKNCRFLQCEDTLQEEIKKMTESLANATVARVSIINRRKDGSDFFNLLTLKPIFDQHGSYSYVIGVQYPVEYELHQSKEIQERDFNYVDQVMSVFPNTMW